MADDLAFTFDTDMFTNGIKKITRGMDTMQTSATTVARGISKGFNVVVAKLAVLKGAFMSIKSTLNQMPEVGKAFGIAKDVFLKNLLYPLRKEIMPLLQRMMDWVRDNRTLFVKWGQTIANVFKSAISGFKSLLGWARSITKTLFGFINDMFGTTIKSFDDLLNIVSFKIALVVEFLKLLARPIMDVLGPLTDMLKNVLLVVLKGVVSLFAKIAKFVIEIGTSFTEGFVKGISGIERPLKRIFESMSGIVETLFTGKGPLEFWKKTFNTLGVIVGTTLRIAFEGIALIIEGIESSLKAIDEFFKSELFTKKIPEFAFGKEEKQTTGFSRVLGESQLPPPSFPEVIERLKNIFSIENIINITGMTLENADEITTKMTDELRKQYDEEFTRGGF